MGTRSNECPVVEQGKASSCFYRLTSSDIPSNHAECGGLFKGGGRARRRVSAGCCDFHFYEPSVAAPEPVTTLRCATPAVPWY